MTPLFPLYLSVFLVDGVCYLFLAVANTAITNLSLSLRVNLSFLHKFIAEDGQCSLVVAAVVIVVTKVRAAAATAAAVIIVVGHAVVVSSLLTSLCHCCFSDASIALSNCFTVAIFTAVMFAITI